MFGKKPLEQNGFFEFLLPLSRIRLNEKHLLKNCQEYWYLYDNIKYIIDSSRLQVKIITRLLHHSAHRYIDFLIFVLDNDYNPNIGVSMRIIRGSTGEDMQLGTFDTGTIIAIVAALVFYLRLIILQRHKVNQAQGNKHTKVGKSASGKRGYVPQEGLRIYSWYLLGIGVALIFLGALMTTLPLFDPAVSSLWWVALTAGILLLGLSIR